MITRLINLTLLVGAVVGGLLALKSGRVHNALLQEHRRLERKVGDLDVADPSKAYLRSIATDDPLHFAWRVYLPAGFHARWETGSGYSSSANSNSREFIARVRFREDEHGMLSMFTKQGGGSSSGGYGNKKVADLVRGRWNEMRIEQLGSDGVVVVDPDEVVSLLRLTLSEEMKAEAKETLSRHYAKRFQDVFFEFRFGANSAFERASANVNR